MFKKLAVSSLIFSLIFPLAAQAYSININNIITDTELLDSDSMSLARIQSFLKDKGSYLANYMTEGIGGAPKTAAEVIFDAANFYEISPKYLMVRLQVEQSLVYDTDPKQTQLDRAMGYGCPDGSGCDPEYSGFFNQINQSAKAIKGSKYLQGILDNGTTISGWGIGITKTTLDGIAVTPVNAATAILYTYTPWVGKYGGGAQH
ncbi:hypothetical protein KKA01_00740 [Patescibacteria group bacterium]|nr:hypothetical protein [Patescibacteria group bacterium]